MRAFELRADDYITKPFSLRLVLMRVEAVLRRAGRQGRQGRARNTAPRLRGDGHGRAPCEPGRRGRASHEHGVDRLLELFLRNPGRVFTREGLLSRVWGYDFIGDESTVNIHIMNLRRKLGSNLIETVRGVGYRLG